MRAVVAPALNGGWQVEELPEPTLGPRDVLVAVEASGICYSDVHLLTDAGYGGTFPRVPGHEFVGRIVSMGAQVQGLEVGQRVGAAWAQRWCGRCGACVAGLTSFCEAGVDVTGGTVDGGHAQAAVVDALALESVPDSIPAAEAAPLFCAGYTVYSALRAIDVRPGERLAVVGIGGLGHLAVQYGRGLGAEVVGVTRSADKHDLLRDLGASEVLVAKQGTGSALRELGGVDAILHTANSVDADLALGLRTGGRLAIAGVSRSSIALTPKELVFGRITVVGTSPGPRHLLREMLRFHEAIAARTIVEVYIFDRAAEALDRVIEGSVRFRAVLVPDS